MKKYNFGNFYLGTFADFKTCTRPREPPDFWSYSGSTYWDLGDRVIRWSDHWGSNISTCAWYLDGCKLSLDYCLAGECLYEEFELVEKEKDWLWKDYWGCDHSGMGT